MNFNPRFPRGKRPERIEYKMTTTYISIHASRGGSDVFNQFFRVELLFQSTLPAGEATSMQGLSYASKKFQSTLPAGEATDTPRMWCSASAKFQSTLPAGEATLVTRTAMERVYDFNPRFPRGKRLSAYFLSNSRHDISIHASRGGSDRPQKLTEILKGISIHASRGGSDQRAVQDKLAEA